MAGDFQRLFDEWEREPMPMFWCDDCKAGISVPSMLCPYCGRQMYLWLDHQTLIPILPSHLEGR